MYIVVNMEESVKQKNRVRTPEEIKAINERAREKYANDSEYRERRKIYRFANKERIKESDQVYRNTHKEKVREKNKNYFENNKEKMREYSRKYHEEHKVIKEKPIRSEPVAVYKEGERFPNIPDTTARVLCSHCNESYRVDNFFKHRRTQKHQNMLKVV